MPVRRQAAGQDALVLQLLSWSCQQVADDEEEEDDGGGRG